PISMPAALGLITGKFRSNFRYFFFFAFAMDRLRRCSATSQACKNGKSFKRDHRTQKAWRVTNVLAHGPGIKLMNGLAEASTNGNTIYASRRRKPQTFLPNDPTAEGSAHATR